MSVSRIRKAASWLGDGVDAATVLARAGLVRPIRPDHLVSMGLGVARWGVTPAAGYAACAALYPGEPAVVDESSSVTFGHVDASSNAIASALRDRGVSPGDRVGVLLRNSVAFVQTVSALAKVGADVVLLNTGFAGPQLAQVLDSEGVRVVVYDAEFTSLIAPAAEGRLRIVAGGARESGVLDLDELALGGTEAPPVPSHKSRQIILTSGTTGAPKGAARTAEGIEPALAFLAAIPLKVRETTVIAAPLFHAWGFANFGLGLLLSSTLVLRRHFDPESVLADIERTRATALVAVPVMLSRMLDLPREVRDRYDTSSLRVVAASGSALPGELALRFMDAFGDVLYNFYGSTEVAYASIAGPEDLRDAPGTAGRPPKGTVVRLLDSHGRDVAQGHTGRIFVGNDMVFEGYTGGQDKERVEGLVSTGDMGRFDAQGRLFVEGRDDEMIISGGENVFPAEVEDLLSDLPDVVEAAVVGVPDEAFGQRLAAFVVTTAGSTLDADGVRDAVKSSLARYKVPRDVYFVDSLPRNATGKVLKRHLPVGG